MRKEEERRSEHAEVSQARKPNFPFATFNDASTTLNAKFRRETPNDCSRETTLRNARHKIEARGGETYGVKGLTIQIPVDKLRVSLDSNSKTRATTILLLPKLQIPLPSKRIAHLRGKRESI